MMNEVLSTIKSRRTTRKYQQKPIEQNKLEAIIEAGLYAPSAHNMQSWHFTVIQDKTLIDEMNTMTKEAAKTSEVEFVRKMANNEAMHVFYNAPVMVVVSGDKNGMMPREDCAAATQNMILAAESFNIGSCWNGMVNFLFNGPKGDAYREKLEIPETHEPYYVVLLGYKDVTATTAPKRSANTVHYL